MSRRLTVHIGVIKTGTTAIQDFLKENCGALQRVGIVVPDQHLALTGAVTGEQVNFFQERRRMTDANGVEELTARINGLFEPDNVRQVIVSAENLSEGDNASTTARWFSNVVEKYDTEVIVYLRRQDEVLLSAWQQWHAKVESDFWSWLVSRVGVFANWLEVLARWEAVIGRERLVVRLYEPRRLVDGDVVADFEKLIGTDNMALLRNTGFPVNPSFAETVVDLVPGGGFFEDVNDYAFYNFISDMVGGEYHRRKQDSAITFEQRMAILERYAETNAWVREAYFAGTDVPDTLFEIPQREDYTVRSRDELRREQIQMVARLVFELSRHRRQ